MNTPRTARTSPGDKQPRGQVVLRSSRQFRRKGDCIRAILPPGRRFPPWRWPGPPPSVPSACGSSWCSVPERAGSRRTGEGPVYPPSFEVKEDIRKPGDGYVFLLPFPVRMALSLSLALLLIRFPGRFTSQVAVTMELQTGHLTWQPRQESLTANGLLHMLQRQGRHSSSLSRFSSSCAAVTGLPQMGHFTCWPRKEVLTAKRLPHAGHEQATVSSGRDGMGKVRVTGG